MLKAVWSESSFRELAFVGTETVQLCLHAVLQHAF